MTGIRPLNDKILISRAEAEEKTKGGIVLPESAKERPRQGEIIAMGAGRLSEKGERVPSECKKGDVVLFKSYAGTEVKFDGKEYILMSEDDILAIIS